MISFSELIKEKREGKQLSINALAKQSGLDPSHVMRMEKGTNKQPSYAVTLKLAKGLDITYQELSQAFSVDGLDYDDINIESKIQKDNNIKYKKDIAGIMSVITEMKSDSGANIENITNLLSVVNELIRNDKCIIIGTTDYTPFIVQLDWYDYKIEEFIESKLIDMECTNVIITQGELVKGDAFNFNDFIIYMLENEIIDEDEAEDITRHYNKLKKNTKNR